MKTDMFLHIEVIGWKIPACKVTSMVMSTWGILGQPRNWVGNTWGSLAWWHHATYAKVTDPDTSWHYRHHSKSQIVINMSERLHYVCICFPYFHYFFHCLLKPLPFCFFFCWFVSELYPPCRFCHLYYCCQIVISSCSSNVCLCLSLLGKNMN